MKNNYLNILLIIIFLTLLSCKTIETTEEKEFPEEIFLSKSSPGNNIQAMIYHNSNEADKSKYKDGYYLAFKKNNTIKMLNYNLENDFEGKKGKITELQWLDENNLIVVIKIENREKNVIFNLQKYKIFE